jgi:hypothetical protein
VRQLRLALALLALRRPLLGRRGLGLRCKAGQLAYAPAEAGLNNAFSVLAANYPATYTGNPNLLPRRRRPARAGA